MSLVARVAAPISKVLARLHRWLPAAWLLSQVPLAALDSDSIGRLRYALMMAGRTHDAACQRLLQGMLRRNSNASPEQLLEFAMIAVRLRATGTAIDLLQRAAHAASDPFTRDAAHCLLRVETAAADGTLQAQVDAMVDALPVEAEEPLTLVPLSSRYLDLWHLWIRQTRAHVPGRVVVMAMDTGALEALQHATADVSVVDVREFFVWDSAGRIHPHTRGVLWWLRTLLLQALVQRGHPVLVLDLDAVPVGNLELLLQDYADVDVLAQQDHSLPVDVDRELGFVLCCGFMRWLPTPASHNLLQRFAAETAVERDDQMALNHILASSGLYNQTDAEGVKRFTAAGVTFACPAARQVSRDLHNGSVVRHFHQTGETVAELSTALGLTPTPQGNNS